MPAKAHNKATPSTQLHIPAAYVAPDLVQKLAAAAASIQASPSSKRSQDLHPIPLLNTKYPSQELLQSQVNQPDVLKQRNTGWSSYRSAPIAFIQRRRTQPQPNEAKAVQICTHIPVCPQVQRIP